MNKNEKYKQKYWIDSFNIRYETEIHNDIEVLLKKLFIKWKEDFKNKQDKDIVWPNDVVLYEKFLKDIKYLINGKINRIITNIYLKKKYNRLDWYYDYSQKLERNENHTSNNDEEMNNFIKHYIENDLCFREFNDSTEDNE